MNKTWFRIKHGLHRAGIIAMIVVVLIGMTIGWLSDWWQRATRVVIVALGLARVEDWLRRQAWWFPWILIVPLAIGAFYFKLYEFGLFAHGRIMRGQVDEYRTGIRLELDAQTLLWLLAEASAVLFACLSDEVEFSPRERGLIHLIGKVTGPDTVSP